MTMTLETMRANARRWIADARANPLFAWGMAAAALIAVADRATKFWVVNVIDLPAKGRIEILPVFDLTFVANRGASFGMLAGGMGSRIVLSLISISIATVMIVWLGRLKRRFAAAGAALIIGGAIGNLHDRVRYGYVVDFLDFSGLMFPWVFNVADTAINVGFACLILDALLHKDRKPSS